jgi:hypothetical protein
VRGSRRIEFWPDYGGALLFEGGARMPLADMAIPADVADRATAWLATYDDAKLDGTDPDAAWMAEGRALYALLRGVLADDGVELVDWEGIWASG